MMVPSTAAITMQIMNSTALALAAKRTARLHDGMYGSFSRVTGFVRYVFTEASNSGRFSSSLSMFCRSHSQHSTDCFRFHSSRYVVAQNDMKIAKNTVDGLSNRYVILANMHELLSFW